MAKAKRRAASKKVKTVSVTKHIGSVTKRILSNVSKLKKEVKEFEKLALSYEKKTGNKLLTATERKKLNSLKGV